MGSLWDVGEEGAGGGIPKGEGGGRNRKSTQRQERLWKGVGTGNFVHPPPPTVPPPSLVWRQIILEHHRTIVCKISRTFGTISLPCDSQTFLCNFTICVVRFVSL